MTPWRVIASAPTEEGLLELRQRGSDWLIVIDGRVLMNSHARRSEEQLAKLALAHLGPNGAKPASAGERGKKPHPKILIGGLGMGFTLRAALGAVSSQASVVVAELNRVVVEWCRGPLALATHNAIGDPRVRVELGDVAALIAATPAGRFDAIILDLYEGPNAASQRHDDPFYGPAALARTHAALSAGGVLAVWAEDPDAPFAKRFTAAGFDVTSQSIGSGGRRHTVYLGRKLAR